MTGREVVAQVASATIAVVLAAGAAYALGHEAGRQDTAPIALTPKDTLRVVFRAVLVPSPRPDTSLRYDCTAAR